LVHGAWHGAWCWERLTPLLQDRGHEVVTMDLPGDDPAATFDTYANVVCEALSPHDDDVIVVGHSLAGLTIPLVAARRPVKRLVYLCALLPALGRTWTQQVRAEPDMMRPGWDSGLRTDGSDRTSWADEELTRSLLFADCDDSTAAAAFARLRPQVGAGRWVCSLSEFPSTPSTSIHCLDDQLVSPDWSRRTAADRLGAEVIEMPGSHSPFLSRPAAVADALLRIACAGLAD
jgi:pimeloyl-ACP methyl ester carboxylesterase